MDRGALAAPLLPLRIFRLRSLTASNLSGVFTGVSFVVFFLGSLYAQLVLGYSAIETGAAFLAASLSIVLGAGIAQSLIGSVGVRPVVPSGFALATVGLVLLAQAPVDGDYFADLFPAFVVFGLGMSFAFVGQQIGAQLGVGPADAGIASGLINTSQQVGGAVAVAIGTTIAATATESYAEEQSGHLRAQRSGAHPWLRGGLLRVRCGHRPRGGRDGVDARVEAGAGAADAVRRACRLLLRGLALLR